MINPPGEGGSGRYSGQPLRIRSIGLTIAVALVTSGMLVAVALASFTNVGLRAGQANSQLAAPSPVPAWDQTATAPTRVPSATPKQGGEPDQRSTAQSTDPIAPRASGSGGSPNSELDPENTPESVPSRPPTSRPELTSPPRVPEPQPDPLPEFSSPFSNADIQLAEQAVTREVRKSLLRVPESSQPDHSGLLQFNARNSTATLSRQGQLSQLMANEAVAALDDIISPPIRRAMMQSASTSFDAAVQARYRGASEKIVAQEVRRTFRRGLTRGFTSGVLPVVQRAVTSIVPEVQGTPAMYIAVLSASSTVIAATAPNVVEDLVEQASSEIGQGVGPDVAGKGTPSAGHLASTSAGSTATRAEAGQSKSAAPRGKKDADSSKENSGFVAPEAKEAARLGTQKSDPADQFEQKPRDATKADTSASDSVDQLQETTPSALSDLDSRKVPAQDWASEECPAEAPKPSGSAADAVRCDTSETGESMSSPNE